MASWKWAQKDSGQYSVYNLPTSNLDLLRTRSEKYETHLHPTGQRWGDKVRQDYENCQQIDKTLPVTTSTDAMDTEEGDEITKMILDKTKTKARQMQRRSRLIKGWDMEPDDAPRPLSVPLPDYENEDRAVGRLTTAMSSIIFPDYEEINDGFITKRWGSKSKENLPWSILDKDQAEGKVRIPSTPTTAFVQYSTEELDQLDQPQHSHRKGQEDEQYLTVPPLVYGITPQGSLAGMDWESEKRDSPFLDQTVLRAENKQDQFPTQTGEVTTPLTQFTQNIMGTSVVTVKPKAKTMQTKTSSQQVPIQPDFYLPNGKRSRLSEVYQIKTTEKSPEGHPAVLIVLENLRTKYNTKYFLLDKYLGYLYATGGETISSEPIEEKGWIYPTESTKPIAGALDEFRLTPYHTLKAVAESTWVPMATSTVERTKGQIGLEKQNNVTIEKEPEQQIEDEQWEFIRYEVEKMKEARENCSKRTTRAQNRTREN